MILPNIAPHTVPDEPLICPVAPGPALVRLSEVIGAWEKAGSAENIMSLRTAREELLTALEDGGQETIGYALHHAQEALIACYTSCENEALCAAAGFPPPGKVSHKARHLEAV